MTDTATPAAETPAAPANPTADRLRRALGDDLLQVIEDRGELTCVVRRGRVLEALGFLKSQPDLAYVHCSDVTAVDYLDLEVEPRFAVVYHLYSFQHNRRLRVRAPLPAEDPAIDSCVDIFPTANWFEREVFDLMGIDFRGHPDLKRILLPDGWEGAPPLRKDTPIGGEDVEFTFNVGRVHGRRSEI